jgi:hypothetical protein
MLKMSIWLQDATKEDPAGSYIAHSYTAINRCGKWVLRHYIKENLSQMYYYKGDSVIHIFIICVFANPVLFQCHEKHQCPSTVKAAMPSELCV